MLNTKALIWCITLAFLATKKAVKAQVISPNCKESCGNVTIPYPFGMQEGCYLSSDFNISCESEIPYLMGSDPLMQVHSISIDTHEIIVYTPVASSCYNKSGLINNTTQLLSVSSANFPFSNTRNKFTALGCDTLGLFVGGDYLTGCLSYCASSSAVDNSSCSGAGCCQNTNMTTGLLYYNITMASVFNHSDSLEFNPCDYAFFGENSFVFKGFSDLMKWDRKVTPTVLDWAILKEPNCSMAKNSVDYACKGSHASCVDSYNGPGYYCQCSHGYEGNPYITDGCQDICKHKTCKSKVIKLASIGSAVVLAVLVTAIFVLWRYLRMKRINERREKYFKQNGGFVLQESLSLLEDAQNAFKVFTAKEMEEATNNFDESRIVGRGGFGVVYMGYLSDGREVAIKKSKSVDQYEIDQFVNEVVLLSKIQHQNVVGFYGCCLETSEPLLVYEFITNGTLLDHLYGEGENSVLPWETRLKIAVETAGVLGYLHQDHRPTIIHSDIKPHNILLDENYNAKVSDFGISKLAPQNETELYTKVKGTLGYLDPEFIQSSQLTDKSDVYSFGVVLLEMLTGQRVLSFDRPEQDRTLVKYFRSSVNEGLLVKILDKRIVNEENVEEMRVVAKIAGKCVSVKSDERPTMKEVAMELGSLWVEVKTRCIGNGISVERRSGKAENYGDTCTSYGNSTSTDHINNKAMFYFVAFAFLTTATSQAISRNCKESCGNVQIPYPFGMQQSCYLNPDFSINCESETPFLVGSDPLMQTPVASACYNKSGLINTTVMQALVTSPKFPFSNTKNKFTVVGCDTLGLFLGDDYLTGCLSFCGNITSVDSGSCSGAGCCQNTNITSGLLSYNITTLSILNHSKSLDFNPCDYAFFGNDSYVFKGLSDFQELGKRKTVSTVLDWAIKDQNCSVAKTSPSYGCKGDQTTICVDSQNGPGYYCQCSPGFQGNPYVTDGCEVSAVLLIVFITGIFVGWRYLRKKRINERRDKYFRQNGGLVLQESLSLLEDAQNAFKVFTAEEMEKATNNFDENRIVGRGGFGVVYMGYLSDGREVAIKKSKSVDKYEIDQFVNEVVLLSKIQHQNVVGFYGCCLETSEPLLVYEFITNGTLLDHLYNEDNNTVLPWETRVKIAVQTAGVLGYLHQDHRPQIIHSDIKPHNILLDENYNTKVSDFGISKLAPQNETELYTKVKGTLGYLDPEFIQSSQLTDKSDVYSFGVVLLEMLTGQRVLSFDRPERDRTLVKYFRSSVDEGSLLGILDRRIVNRENVEELREVAKIAGRCVCVKADERPTMKEVAMELGSLWIQVKKRCIANGIDVEWRSGHVIVNGAEIHGDTSTTNEHSTSQDHLLLQMLEEDDADLEADVDMEFVPFDGAEEWRGNLFGSICSNKTWVFLMILRGQQEKEEG
ncbi:hypothetical protein V2J09_007405 [Rumex salicifolius]